MTWVLSSGAMSDRWLERLLVAVLVVCSVTVLVLVR